MGEGKFFSENRTFFKIALDKCPIQTYYMVDRVWVELAVLV
jgi:hypothetical protein